MTTLFATTKAEAVVSRVRICAPEELRDVQELHDRITRRAYELFEARHCRHGDDCRDWLQAEAEFLQPIEFRVIESDREVIVRAGVPGFEAHELTLALDSRQAMVRGKKFPMVGHEMFYLGWIPFEIFKRIDLPAEVMPREAVCTLCDGVLELVVPKK